MLRERQKLAMVVAEFLGAGILTIVTLAVVTNFGNPVFVSIGMGVALASAYLTFSNVSGAHLNPAVTLALLSARRIQLFPAVIYVAAQLLGGVMAYALFTYLTNQEIKPSTNFDSRVLVSEAAGAFVFAMGWAAAHYNRYDTGKTAFVLGASFIAAILTASFINTGIVNPAVALGVRSWVWGTYVIGPVLGAVIGFNLYALLFAPAKELVAEQAAAEAGSDASTPSAKRKRS